MQDECRTMEQLKEESNRCSSLLQDKETVIHQLQEEVMQLKNECKSKSETIEQLKEKELESKDKESLLQDITASNALIAELNETNLSLQHEIDQLQEDKRKCEQQLESQKSAQELYGKQIDSLSSQLQSKEKEISTKSREIADMRNSLNSIQSQLEKEQKEHAQQILQLEKRRDELISELKAASSGTEDMDDMIALEAEIRHKEEEIIELRKNLQLREKEKEESKSLIEQLRETCRLAEEHEKEISEQLTRYELAESNDVNREESIRVLSHRVSELESQLQEISVREDHTKKQLDEKVIVEESLRKELAELSDSLTNTSSMNEKWKELEKSHNREIDSLKSSLQDSNSTIESLKSSLQESNSTIDSLKSSLQESNSTIDSLKSSLQESNSTIESLKSSLQESNSTIDSLKSSLQDSNSTIDSLKSSLQDSNSTIDSLKSSESSLRKENNSLRLSLQSAQQNCSNFQMEYDKLRQTINNTLEADSELQDPSKSNYSLSIPLEQVFSDRSNEVIASLQQENQELNKRVVSLIISRETARKSVQLLESRITFLQNDLSYREKENATLAKYLEEKNKLVGQLRGQLTAQGIM